MGEWREEAETFNESTNIEAQMRRRYISWREREVWVRWEVGVREEVGDRWEDSVVWFV